MKQILYVEDDTNLAKAYIFFLQSNNFVVLHVSNAKDAIEAIKTHKPDAYILDILLNDEKNGIDIAHIIRKTSNAPILFTTSLDDNQTYEAVFSMENTDYICKPFKGLELYHRLCKALNLAINKKHLTYRQFAFNFGENKFNHKAQSLYINRKHLTLSPLENDVLLYLCNNMNTYKTRAEIVQQVWDNPDNTSINSLNNVIHKIQKKLKGIPEITLDTSIRKKLRLLQISEDIEKVNTSAG